MSTEWKRTGWWLAVVALIAVGHALVPVGDVAAAPDPDDYAARFKSAEDKLAETDRLYLVCDLRNSRLRLKMKGIVVRDYRYAPLDDSDQVISFRERAHRADSVVHPLTRLHLYEAAHMLNDTVLGIVSEATKASAELLQRYRPERMAVTFEGRLGFEVVSDVDGGAVSMGSNWAESAKELAERVLGSKMLELKLEPDDAMSLYGACQSKPPVLIAP